MLYYLLGIVLAVSKTLIYIAILIFFYRTYYEGYKSLPQSDVEDDGTALEPDTDEDSADNDIDSLRKTAGVDTLEIWMEAKNEIKELGG